MGKALRVSEEIVAATRMTEEELAREFAVFLYLEAKLSLARAKEVAGMDLVAFQHLLAGRGIPIRYGKADLRADVATLRKLKRPVKMMRNGSRLGPAIRRTLDQTFGAWGGRIKSGEAYVEKLRDGRQWDRRLRAMRKKRRGPGA